MKIRYDPSVDALSIRLSEGEIEESDEVSEGVVMDYDEKDLDKLQKLLKPAPNDLLVPTMVSQKVNSVKNDDASVLIEQATLL